jgi:hypothetical protein
VYVEDGEIVARGVPYVPVLVRRYTAFWVIPELDDCVQVSLTLPPFALVKEAEGPVGDEGGVPGGEALTSPELGLSPEAFDAETT